MQRLSRLPRKKESRNSYTATKVPLKCCDTVISFSFGQVRRLFQTAIEPRFKVLEPFLVEGSIEGLKLLIVSCSTLLQRSALFSIPVELNKI